MTVVLADGPAAAPADEARRWAAKGMRKLRDGGWTVYATVCLPPRKSGDPDPPAEGAWDAWSFAAHAYKVVEGVSYFAIAQGLGQVSGDVEMTIEMRAPSSHEPVTDLFPDRPPPLPAGTSCVEPVTCPRKSSPTARRWSWARAPARHRATYGDIHARVRSGLGKLDHVG
ncbi:hypothetical protein [Nonomuraea diastatica]|uniref:Uncharacterized protein n=1 Tax=Nonomuraea diastatica TaxID=1848329 RepID=A0A4R4X563_9ACTN|nr:hypothetical protein [Nonomuraea diastatica]TDD25501.1 hypothetical protein E1294_02630 [Nonomuraea diastatica]